MNEPNKIVTVNGVKYRIGRIPAETGHWIAYQLLGARALNDIEINRIVNGNLFSVVEKVTEPADGGLPVYSGVWSAGRFIAPELSYDLDSVDQLRKEVVQFNFGPFFLKLSERVTENNRQGLLTMSL